MSTGLIARAWTVTNKSYYRDCLVVKGYLNGNVYQEVPLDSDKKSEIKVIKIQK